MRGKIYYCFVLKCHIVKLYSVFVYISTCELFSNLIREALFPPSEDVGKKTQNLSKCLRISSVNTQFYIVHLYQYLLLSKIKEYQKRMGNKNVVWVEVF